MRIITLYIYNNTKQILPQFFIMNTDELQSYHAQQIKEYRDAKYKQDEKDKQYCYKPYRTIHNY